MIGKLVVEELQQAVALVWRSEGGSLVLENLDAGVPLFPDKAALTWRWSNEAEEGSTVGGGAGGKGECGAVGEDDLRKADDRSVEGGEIPVDTCAYTSGVI